MKGGGGAREGRRDRGMAWRKLSRWEVDDNG